MQTSDQGIAELERHEGVVLRAYRCPAGIWTIYTGLTAASGVITPKAGMVITRSEGARLLALALQRNYEPAVRAAMPGARQHEFDAGLSFHFNTGAIGRASWVRKWINRDWPGTKIALALWNKGGGKILPGLSRRRAEEYLLLKDGRYGARVDVPAPATILARYVAPITTAEMPAIRDALRQLGYTVENLPGIGIQAETVRKFQRDHGLTEDGIIGRATVTTLERVLAARAKTAVPAGVAAAGAVEAVPLDGLDVLGGIPWAGEAALLVAGLRFAWLAIAYRDTIAPILDRHLPRVAALLRSF